MTKFVLDARLRARLPRVARPPIEMRLGYIGEGLLLSIIVSGFFDPLTKSQFHRSTKTLNTNLR